MVEYDIYKQTFGNEGEPCSKHLVGRCENLKKVLRYLESQGHTVLRNGRFANPSFTDSRAYKLVVEAVHPVEIKYLN